MVSGAVLRAVAGRPMVTIFVPTTPVQRAASKVFFTPSGYLLSRRYSSSLYSWPSRGRRPPKKALSAYKNEAGVQYNSPELKDVACEMFFSGNKPLLGFHGTSRVAALNHGVQPSVDITYKADAFDDAEHYSFDTDAFAYPLGTMSASGKVLDPVMRSLSPNILVELRGNRPPTLPGAVPSSKSAISDGAMSIIESKFDAAARGVIYDVDPTADILESMDLFSTLKCCAMMDPDMRGIKELKSRLDEKGVHSFVIIDETSKAPEELLEERTTSQSTFRNGLGHKLKDRMEMTSVVRKRRLKMKKHKLRKRRRAQRALKRKLGH
ncbi:uncharacterized protein V1516DRAFT_668482 [Lipomyces oligophaga]|uniref:uncharacterized protein n=1 Tax=Lipomyces oligophaga TaxID=45792 RepID=UPI0034CF3575